MQISIIVPIYNTKEYLERCVESLLAQTLKEIEIILVDDGSTDGSGIVCDEMKKRDSRITVLHIENGGTTVARNAGLAVATGEYIGFVDSDDWVEANMYESLYKSVISGDAEMAICGHYASRGDYSFVEPLGIDAGCYSCDSEEIRRNIIYREKSSVRGISLALWDKLFKRNFLFKHQKQIPENIKYSEDEICVTSCLLDAKNITVIDTPLYHYCKREGSICTSQNEKYFEDISRTFSAWKNVVSKYADSDCLIKKINKYFLENIARGVNALYGFDYGLLLPTYIPPYEYLMKNGFYNIILYGAGFVGQNYHQSIQTTGALNIVAWVDQKFCNLDLLKSLEYDAILIAVEYAGVANEIIEDLERQYSIPRIKIVFVQPQKWIDLCER